MMLVDAGPLVALFDPQDLQHPRCSEALARIHEPIHTTMPVLTEAFHLLQPQSQGADSLREFISTEGLSIVFFDRAALARSFELMEKYADHPMDFADASLIVTAERLGIATVFTLDRRHFESYRVRRGYRYYSLEIFPEG